MMKNIKYPYALAIGWGIFIFVLSIWPGKDFPQLPDWSDLLSLDKMVHITFYALLTWLILRGKRQNTLDEGNPDSIGKRGVSIRFMLWTAAFSCGFGWFLEWFQGEFCQDRMSDVMDGIANTIGAAIGLCAFFVYQKRNKTSKNSLIERL